MKSQLLNSSIRNIRNDFLKIIQRIPEREIAYAEDITLASRRVYEYRDDRRWYILDFGDQNDFFFKQRIEHSEELILYVIANGDSDFLFTAARMHDLWVIERLSHEKFMDLFSC